MIETILYDVWIAFQLLIMAYLAFGTMYIFVFAVASVFPYLPKPLPILRQNRIAVMVPGYKEDAVILETAEQALNQDYPKTLFDVIIIADSFSKETLAKLAALPVILIEVSFDTSTKAKALNKAMALLPEDNYDIALVLDADNIMAPDFLTRINQSFNNGYIAVQGHRVAKNKDTAFAILDSISEEISNSIFRKGHRRLGISSGLAGSGMAFQYVFFKNMMSGVHAIGGFDKEIELIMTKARVKIEYLDKCYIHDEKVQEKDVFVKQRRRWLSAQIYYASFFPKALFHFIRYQNFDYFDKAAQMLLPPRILLIGFLPIFSALSLILDPLWMIWLWLILTAIMVVGIFLAIPQKSYNRSLMVALAAVPKGFVYMFISLISSRGANKRFIHTVHKASISETQNTK
ncbi:MAG: glycosyltransferase family 2 protein [Bacteroidales bacterium]|nr:glycosyltransferase family 2 protein [Bacteroidales bacterium]